MKSLEEAKAFLADQYLGHNLKEISQELLLLKTNNATEVFGKPDDKKLRSSMTLFAVASGNYSVFHEVLDKFFDGNHDRRTLNILKRNENSETQTNVDVSNWNDLFSQNL